MATDEELKSAGFTLPQGGDLISLGDDAIRKNANASYEFSKKTVRDRVAFRRQAGNIDLNTLTVNEDVLLTSMTGVTNAPDASSGLVQVRNVGGNIVQVWFTAVRANALTFSRRGTASSWSAWQLVSTFGITPVSSQSFDEMVSPGVYPIQSISHPGQPAARPGTLEVLPASGRFMQRYTTFDASPLQFIRTSRTADVWGEWQELPSSISIETLRAEIRGVSSSSGNGGGISDPVREKGNIQPFSTTSKKGSEIISSLSLDRLKGWNYGTAVLSETTDYGKTWKNVVDSTGKNPFAGSTVESVRQLDNGELLITNYIGSTNRRAVWITKGYGTDSLSFVKTLESRAPMIKFTSAWSQSSYKSIVLINEYGPKTGMLWVGQEVKPEENARYTYLSTDYGKTWRIIFDLNTYLKESQNHTTTDLQHLHGVAWDMYWDRIWISFGDGMGGAGSNGIVYSDDMGETWNTAHYYKGSTPPHQVVGIQPMPQCVLFYGDMGPDVIRIDRSQGKYKSGGYETVVAFNSSAPGKHLCQGFTRIQRAGDDAPALAVFSAEGEASPSFAISTMDGFTFHEIWRDDQNQSAGMGGRSIIGPTLTGKVIISSNDLKVSGSWTEIVLPAPGY